MGSTIHGGGKIMLVAAAMIAGSTMAYCFGMPGCFNPLPQKTSPENARKGAAMSVSTQTFGKVYHVSETQFDQEVLRSQVPVLVDFYADWCGPCKMLAPVLEELARETAGAKIVKVNIDQSQSLAVRYGISSIPTLVVFKEGQPAGGTVGLASKAHLRRLLND
jgi:thioredoxin 1